MTVLIKRGTLSVLKMYIVSGFSLLLMKSIASCLVATVMIGKMGPKISSWNQDMENCAMKTNTLWHTCMTGSSGLTPVRTVGAM